MSTIRSALAAVTYIPSLTYEAAVRLRERLYSASILPQLQLGGPVISIGNITAGGTGKTPLVIYVAQTLLKLGRIPAVLSRGYGRQKPNQTWILAPGDSVSSPAKTLGDEPALMRRCLPSVWMGISGNRFRTGTAIAGRQAQAVFVLDDGFQHRRLHRDLDVVVIDRTQPLGANHLLPRGTLREPLSGLRRCQAIVINGAFATGDSDPVESEIRSLHADAAIFHCEQTICSLIPFSSWLRDPASPAPAIPPRSAYLVSALGNPDRFERDIRQLDIQVRGIRSYPDHYWLTRKDWVACAGEASRLTADAIITTEKDAVKIAYPPDFPLLVSIQSTRIDNSDAFESLLKNCIETYS